MSNPEFASQELDSVRIRDFSRRILYAVADRLSMYGEDVSSTYRVYGEGGNFDLRFSAEYGGGPQVFEYDVTLGYQEPLGSEWHADAVRRLLCLEPDDESGTCYIDAAGQEVDDPDDAVAVAYDGLVSTEYSYTFEVPAGGRLARATKTMSYTFFDGDEEEAGTEVAYRHSARRSNVDDLEAMWADGTVYMDMQAHEAELSRVTVDDLEMILHGLKYIGLISKNAVTLSKRLTN